MITRNNIQLQGRIGQDPSLKTFDNGRGVIQFSLATQESYKNKEGEYVNTTDWHNIKMFVKADNKLIEKLEKGKEVAIDGKLQYDQYEDKDGNSRTVAFIKVENLQF